MSTCYVIVFYDTSRGCITRAQFASEYPVSSFGDGTRQLLALSVVDQAFDSALHGAQAKVARDPYYAWLRPFLC
jgi:hypothetical protein